MYDKKAEEATKHADKLKQERERCLDRIRGEPMIILITKDKLNVSGYHRHIDGCSQEMSKSMYRK